MALNKSERESLEELRDRLAERFPDASREQIDSAIETALAGLGGPIRDFVPVLVEREAKKELRKVATYIPTREPEPDAEALKRDSSKRA